jgi:hypothetical protein
MKTILATMCLFLFAGCAAETGQPSEDDAARNAPDPAVEGPDSDEKGNPYTITEVTIGADGRERVAVYPRTKAPDATALGTGLHTKDYNAEKAPCSDSTLRLYDASLERCAAMGCNTICFKMTDPFPTLWKTGEINLSRYCLTSACTMSWNSEVRSYWSGSMSFGLKRDYAGDSWKCADWVSSHWIYANAASCGQNSNTVVFVATP